MTRKYFNIDFGVSGTRVAIPDTDPGDGSMNFTDGYGPYYSLDPAGGPPALLPDRGQMNEIFYYQTQAIQALQQWYAPDFITSADNGGSPYSYSLKQRVVLAGEVYESNVNSNTTTPPGSSWTIVPTTGAVAIPEATAGGTANAITATFSPSIGTLSQNILVAVRHVSACTGAMTFNPNGLGATDVYKLNNQAIVSGDVPGAGFWGLYQRDQTLGKWQLLNPATVNVGIIGTNQGGTGQITPAASFDALTVTASNVTAAATTSIFAAAGSTLTITGNTGMTSFGANTVGQLRWCKIAGTPTVTYNATSMITPGNANITFTAGDNILVKGLGGVNAEIIFWQPNQSLQFTSSLSTNGYQKLPSGMIMQWGQTGTIAIDDTVSVAFPIAFPTACLNVQATGNHVPVTGVSVIAQAYSFSTTHVTIANDGSQAGTITWFAVGH